MDLTNAGVLRTDERVTERAVLEARLAVLPVGAVLVAMYGGFKQIGRTGVLRVPAATNQAITAVLPASARLNSDYLLHFLNHNIHYWRTVASSSRKDPNITKADVKALPLALPSLCEQTVIAGILNDAGKLIATLERIISKKQAIKHGMMQQLLTGKTRLPGFIDPWREVMLSEVASVDPEALPATTDPKAELDYISLEDVERGELLGHTQVRFGSAPSRARRVLREFDVLFGTVRPNLQSHTLYSGGLRRPIASTGFAVIRPKHGDSNPHFLFYLLMSHQTSEQIDRIIAGSNYPAVSSTDVRNLSFNLPALAEQRAIGEVLADCDAELSVLKTRLFKTRATKTGMMQQLLTGRTRIPVKESSA